MKECPRLALTGGGTGGHIYPALAVADEMKSRGWDVVYLGTAGGMEARLVPEAGYRFLEVPAAPFHRRHPLRNFTSLAKQARGFAAARSILAREKPHVILGTGGYVSVPACLAAASLGIPVILHESNAVSGLANRALSGIAEKVLISWEGPGGPRFGGKFISVGLPIRSRFGDTTRAKARAALGLSETDKVLLAFGGSRGAQSLNSAMLDVATRLEGVTIIWATGAADHDRVARVLGSRSSLRLHPYIADMPGVMPAADLAVTRAGAMTLAELATAGIPAVLIPYPLATADHQTANARRWAEKGAGVLISDARARDQLYDAVMTLLSHPEKLRAMAGAARSLARPDAARHIAEILENVAPIPTRR